MGCDRDDALGTDVKLDGRCAVELLVAVIEGVVAADCAVALAAFGAGGSLT
ncbi:hypothetical protein D9M71_555890 [compost metagenome]